MIPRLYPSVDIADLCSSLEGAQKQGGGEPAITFERKFAEAIGAQRCLALTSGRTTLRLAVGLLGLAEGDEALLPSFTCPVVADALISEGITPVPIDLTLPSYQLDMESADRALSPRCKLILPTAYFGLPLNLEPLAEFCQANKLAVLLDSAQGIDLDRWWGEVATLARSVPLLVMGSFNLDKHLPLGGGGFLASFEPHLSAKLEEAGERLAVHTPQEEAVDLAGMALQMLLLHPNYYKGYLHFDLGRELLAEGKVSLEEAGEICVGLSAGKDMDETCRSVIRLLSKPESGIGTLFRRGLRFLIPSYPSQPSAVHLPKRMGQAKAEFGLPALEKLPEFNSFRRRNGLIIHNALGELSPVESSKVWLPLLPEEGAPLLRYPLVMADRAQAVSLSQRLSRTGFEAGAFNYPQPLHRIPTYRKYLRMVGKLPVCEKISEGMVNLPLWPGMSLEQLGEMTEVIFRHLGGER